MIGIDHFRAQNGQLPGGNWSSWGRPAGNGGKKGGGKKETAAPPPPPQAALARQRLLTLALDENETIRLASVLFCII